MIGFRQRDTENDAREFSGSLTHLHLSLFCCLVNCDTLLNAALMRYSKMPEDPVALGVVTRVLPYCPLKLFLLNEIRAQACSKKKSHEKCNSRLS